MPLQDTSVSTQIPWEVLMTSSMTLGVSEAAAGLGTWDINLFSCSGELCVTHFKDWQEEKVSETWFTWWQQRLEEAGCFRGSLYLLLPQEGQTEMLPLILPMSMDLWCCSAFPPILGYSGKTVCLFKSFLGSFPILAWTPDIWLLNSFSRVLLTNARVLLWGFTGTLGNSLAAQSWGPELPKPSLSSVMVCAIQGFTQKHMRTVSVQIALCGPDFYTWLYGPPWLRAMEMKSMCTSELSCRNFLSLWSAFVS